MRQEVVPDVGVFGEASLADLAAEGPAAVVHELVRLQVAGRRERLVAVAALVRLFLSSEMAPHVLVLYTHSKKKG